MRRFFIDSIDGNAAVIADADQLHHLKDVLRLKPGDEVSAVDAGGCEYTGIIAAIGKKQAGIKITAVKPARRRRVMLTVACAVPRNEHMDDIVDTLTQLGVARVIPMMTERVVVRLDENKKAARLERWRKIAMSAVRQSRRRDLPDIAPVTDFREVIAQLKDYELKLVPHLEGERRLIRDVLSGVSPRTVAVLIGPEGDFTPEEVALALEAGFIPVSLGDTVLRVAAAAGAVASYIELTLAEQ